VPRSGAREFAAGREHDRLCARGCGPKEREAAFDAILVPVGERIVEKQRQRLGSLGKHPSHREAHDEVHLLAGTRRELR